MDGFGVFGVVKETGVDDEGLADFYSKFFSFPLYRDENLTFYNDFFGKSKVALQTYNPLKLYRGYKRMTSRLSDKGLEGNYKGEGLIQGGIIIFDRAGKARYAYLEETGTPLPMDDIIVALDVVRNEKNEL